MALKIIMADYTNDTHAAAVVSVLDAYAQDPMGGGESLSNFTRDNLVASLREFSGAFSVLAYDGDRAVALLQGNFRGA